MSKKIFAIAAVALLAACGGAEKAGDKIDTKDVKGTVNADGGEIKDLTAMTDEGKYEAAYIDYGDYQVSITPTKKSFEENWAQVEESNKSFGKEVSEVTKGENTIFYKEDGEFAGKKTSGYRFYVYKKGKDKSYWIKGGDSGLGPIAKKEDADKAFAAAKSFEPAE